MVIFNHEKAAPFLFPSIMRFLMWKFFCLDISVSLIFSKNGNTKVGSVYEFSDQFLVRRSVFLPETVLVPIALPVYGYAVC